MFSHLSRTLTPLALALSLLSGSMLAAAAPRREQQQSPSKADGRAQSDKQTQSDQKTAPEQDSKTAAPVVDHHPLSVNEDPNMVGKRNINKGIIAKISGSLEKEVALGRQLAAEVDRQAKFIDDPIVTEYINRVGQNIVLHSDAKVPFTIKVIDSDEVNAFALPGGFFYVNKGLILAADNEAELAGVMGHEIAHVAARHAVENQAKGTLAEFGLIASSIFLGGLPGAAIYNAEQIGLLATFLKFSRANEAEADRLGVQYLYAAGYDPSSMATMFEKLEAQNKKKPGLIAKAFSTHPQSVDRFNASRALVARFPEREEYVVSTSEFQRVKARLLRLSNAKASTAGDLANGDDRQPRRPTLKRRSPAPDDTTTSSSTDDQKSTDQKSSEPPKLKRRTPAPDATAQPPNSNP